MKKLLSIAIILIAASTMAFSQVQQEEIDYYQSIFGMEKKGVVASFLKLDETDSFWKIYDAYEKERKDIGQKQINLLLDYAKNYETLTDDKTDDLVKESMRIRKSSSSLIAKYYKKVKKEKGSKIAAQFYQIENYFVIAIRAQLYSDVPLIGELE